MELIKIHYTPSIEVRNFKEIQYEIAALKKFIIEADQKRQCYAIHHSQVHPHPFNFFVVHPRYTLGDDRLFDSTVIINPKIIENVDYVKPSWDEVNDLKWSAEEREMRFKNYSVMPASISTQREEEGCMSFPFRATKKVERFVAVNVTYQDEEMKLITKKLEGPAAHIFQHEYDHSRGLNIYFTH